MNRKTKKYVRAALILVFFLGAGVWYFFFEKSSIEKKETDTELTSILDTVKAEPSVTEEPEKKASEETVVVYVCGAVQEPGIYTLTPDSRLYEAVTMAGGFSSEADPAYHNLARSITDGERIYILSVAETKELSAEFRVSGEEGAEHSATKNGIINLNTATAEQLMDLPGIGEAKATAILAYRAKIGSFSDIEEIMNVSGIGEAMFEKIKDKITVK